MVLIRPARGVHHQIAGRWAGSAAWGPLIRPTGGREVQAIGGRSRYPSHGGWHLESAR
jgi:hypothetical protein